MSLEAALKLVDGLIIRGELQGNGCDAHAQRNGVILAYNALFYLRDRADNWPEPIEDED